jgi:uncharacterized protein YukJ
MEETLAIASYGILKGKAIEVRLGAGQSPHYEVRIIDETTDYRIAINVKSQLAPSEVEYVILERFEHPITALADRFPLGFTALQNKPSSGALDFIRGNLFNRSLVRPLPANLPGFDNDLNDKIDRIMQRAVSDEQAVVCAFGQRWGPEPGLKDKYFAFLPGNGIHDIHMNQGNVGQFVNDDGVYQDGGLLIHFPDQGEWIAAFMKFQSQAWHTDDVTGHTIGTAQPPAPSPTPPAPTPPAPTPPAPPTSVDPQGLVRIVAALVNSVKSPEVESVTLLNTAPHQVNLNGWALLDTQKARLNLSGAMAPGSTRVLTITQPLALSNKGGVITLIDEKGLKVDGVSYTKQQAKDPGWTLVF